MKGIYLMLQIINTISILVLNSPSLSFVFVVETALSPIFLLYLEKLFPENFSLLPSQEKNCEISQFK